MDWTAVRPRRKSFLDVAEQVVNSVRSDRIKPGEMLPSERELAHSFGVSRQVVREALSALQLIGLVETRQGLGTVILRKPSTAASADLVALAEDESPSDVMDARLVVEPQTAALAAQKLLPTNRDNLVNLVDRMMAPGLTHQEFAELDFQFHVEVAEASQNPLLARVVVGAMNQTSRRLWQAMRQAGLERTRDLLDVYRRQHSHTLDRLIAGDPEGAEESMRKHLQTTKNNALYGAED